MTSKTERLFLDVHVLQTVPPSCVNRDDTGSPKTAVYGGVTRARVSSQSWKRAMRLLFEEQLPKNLLGTRTKKIVEMVAEEIRHAGENEKAEELAQRVLSTAGLKITNAQDGTGALFFMSRAQAEALAQLALEGETPTKAQALKALNNAPGVDVALFGRMVADNKMLNVDAAAQVAHSLSTHKVENEYDYFTAVDDMAPEDNAGAGHIGTVEFNSATLYRYGTVAIHELQHNLLEGTAQAVRAFVDAFVRAMPTGKQNTFANRTLPYAVLVCLRKDQPINLAGAFEGAVKAKEEGYAAPSAQRLVEYTQQVYADFADEPAATLIAGRGLDALGEAQPFKRLLDMLEQEVQRFLDGLEVTS
ncbi:MAG: type I-E CRISPR-associated protein Cas7/Cse4/CasC [Eubacteriales bacterium]|nr:type I-E CRISPR-associated protein Cas7/Cse4/CasC [Eubacteriales bacterium]